MSPDKPNTCQQETSPKYSRKKKNRGRKRRQQDIEKALRRAAGVTPGPKSKPYDDNEFRNGKYKFNIEARLEELEKRKGDPHYLTYLHQARRDQARLPAKFKYEVRNTIPSAPNTPEAVEYGRIQKQYTEGCVRKVRNSVLPLPGPSCPIPSLEIAPIPLSRAILNKSIRLGGKPSCMSYSHWKMILPGQNPGNSTYKRKEKEKVSLPLPSFLQSEQPLLENKCKTTKQTVTVTFGSKREKRTRNVVLSESEESSAEEEKPQNPVVINYLSKLRQITKQQQSREKHMDATRRK